MKFEKYRNLRKNNWPDFEDKGVRHTYLTKKGT